MSAEESVVNVNRRPYYMYALCPENGPSRPCGDSAWNGKPAAITKTRFSRFFALTPKPKPAALVLELRML